MTPYSCGRGYSLVRIIDCCRAPTFRVATECARHRHSVCRFRASSSIRAGDPLQRPSPSSLLLPIRYAAVNPADTISTRELVRNATKPSIIDEPFLALPSSQGEDFL